MSATSLNVKLSVSGVQTVAQGINRVASSIKAMTAIATGVAGVAVAFSGISKVTQSINRVVQLGGELNHLRSIGAGAARSMLALREALDDVGGSADDAAILIRFMQRNIADAANEGGEAERAFARLNLPVQELLAMSVPQQMRAIGEAMNRIEDPALKTALAIDIFGKAGTQMIAVFEDGEAFESLSKGAGLFGLVMARNARVLDDIGDRLRRVSEMGQRFFAGFLDQLPLNEIEQALKRWLEETDFTFIGQRIGAWFNVALVELRNGRLSEFLALSIAAGLEEGREHWARFVEFMRRTLVSNVTAQLQSAVLDAIGAVVKGIAGLLTDILDLVAAGGMGVALWLGDHLRAVAQDMGNSFRSVFADVTNFFAGALEKLLNGFFGLLHVGLNLIGVKGAFSPAAFGRVGSNQTDVREPMGLGDAFDQSYAAVLEGSGRDRTMAKINEVIGAAKQLLGIQEQTAEAVEFERTAREKLKGLIEAQITAHANANPPPSEDPKVFTPMFNVKRYLIDQEAGAKRELERINTQLVAVEQDFTRTEVEKYRDKKKLLGEQKRELMTIAALLRAMADLPGLSEDDRKSATAKSLEFDAQAGAVDTRIAGLGPNPLSLREQMQAAMVDLRNEAGSMAQSIARTFKTVIGGAINSITQGITELIKGTVTWGQALWNIGSNIFSMLIEEIVRMGVQWFITHVFMEAIAWAFDGLMTWLGWKRVTETNAQESAKSPALATNAALASAGSYGLSAVVGIALLAALVGGVVGALAFKDGGYVQGPGTGTSDSILARLSNGEYVMPAESVNRIGLPALEAMKNGEAANVPSVGGATSVAIFDDRAKASQWLKTKGGRKALMDTVGKHQHEFRG